MPILWDDVRFLDAIHTEATVGSAARALGVSVSTVYRRVAALEESLGTPCLARDGGTEVLTPAGRTLAVAGRSSRRAIARAVGEIEEREGARDGVVSVTTVEGLFPLLVDPIAQVQREHGLRVTLYLGDSGPSVRDREVDVAIGVMRRPPQGCWGRRLARLSYAVFGTADAIARKPEPAWITRSFDESYAPEAAWERDHVPQAAVSAPFAALVTLVAKGLGVGLMPCALAAQHPSLVEWTGHGASTAKLQRSVWLLTHADLRRSPRVVTLMGALSAHLGRVL